MNKLKSFLKSEFPNNLFFFHVNTARVIDHTMKARVEVAIKHRDGRMEEFTATAAATHHLTNVAEKQARKKAINYIIEQIQNHAEKH